jgi:hypothetical protein
MQYIWLVENPAYLCRPLMIKHTNGKFSEAVLQGK